MALDPGTHLGQFHIISQLGAGGMGEVYSAKDMKLGRDVALKVLPQSVASDVGRLNRFGREARALATLSHPNIVTIFSIDDTGGVPFFTMELVDGASLAATIPGGGMLLGNILGVALPIADALAAAHEKGIIHRDLKPANVMVDTRGRVKVLDFGLAKSVGRPPPGANCAETALATVAGMVFGTVAYMSPEQIAGHADEPRSDLFSYGVLLYEMASGVAPFQGDSTPSVMAAVLRDTPRPLTQCRPDLPAHFARVVHRCLEKDPSQRYQTMREVQRELQDLKKNGDSAAPEQAGLGAIVRQVPPQSASIAVRALRAPAGNLELQSFADGLTDDIAGALSLFPYLSVAAREASRQTRYVLDGSVRQVGNTLRVAVRLVDLRDGTQLWAETYPSDVTAVDVFAVQDDVTDRVVATIADVYGVVMRSMMRSIREMPIDTLSSSELLLRYRSYHHTPNPQEHESLRLALEAQALRDPNNPELWAGLAYLYTEEYSHFLNPQPEPLVRARRAAEHAIELEPGSQHAWEALAGSCFFGKDFQAFLSAADRALALNGRNTNTAAWMALLLGHMGQGARAVQMVGRAMAMNSNHPSWYHFVEFEAQYQARQFDAAYRTIKRINMTELVWTHVFRAGVCGQLGLAEEARAAIRKMLALEPAYGSPEVRAEVNRRWYMDPLGAVHLEGYDKAAALVEQLDAAS
jgi:eukaryotic-like serine/threonine-protein kinase